MCLHVTTKKLWFKIPVFRKSDKYSGNEFV